MSVGEKRGEARGGFLGKPGRRDAWARCRANAGLTRGALELDWKGRVGATALGKAIPLGGDGVRGRGGSHWAVLLLIRRTVARRVPGFYRTCMAFTWFQRPESAQMGSNPCGLQLGRKASGWRLTGGGAAFRWLPMWRNGRISAMVEVTAIREEKFISLKLPWEHEDGPRQRSIESPTIQLLAKLEDWQTQLKSGSIKSCSQIAKREGMTRARVSQLFSLVRLTEEARASVRRLAKNSKTDERFSIRRLITVSKLPSSMQLREIEKMASEPCRLKYGKRSKRIALLKRRRPANN